MLGWLGRNAEPLGAIGAIATAFAALSALIIIPVQIGEADRIQRDQTAREIYREFLNLTVQKPELAQADFCTMSDAKDIAAYGAYVEYALYTAEQMVASSPDWRAPMAAIWMTTCPICATPKALARAKASKTCWKTWIWPAPRKPPANSCEGAPRRPHRPSARFALFQHLIQSGVDLNAVRGRVQDRRFHDPQPIFGARLEIEALDIAVE